MEPWMIFVPLLLLGVVGLAGTIFAGEAMVGAHVRAFEANDRHNRVLMCQALISAWKYHDDWTSEYVEQKLKEIMPPDRFPEIPYAYLFPKKSASKKNPTLLLEDKRGSSGPSPSIGGLPL